jgi:hypothetical protein
LQREDLFLKELQNFIRFLQRLLEKDEVSSKEAHFATNQSNVEYLELIHTEFFEQKHLDFLENQPSEYLQQLCLFFLEKQDIQKSKITYAIYTSKSKTIDLAIEQKIQKLS